VADGIVKVDGNLAFEVKDLKVGLFSDAAASLAQNAAAPA
jgi:hypothetical protein